MPSTSANDGGIPRSNIVALPPPSYEEVVAESMVAVVVPPPTEPCTCLPDAVSPTSAVPPPPSYDALYGRVSHARRKITPQVFAYMRETCSCLPSGTFTVLINIVPVLMIIIGCVYVRDCPQGKFIPGWLIIAGFIWLIKPLMLLTTLVRRTAEEQRLERHRQRHTRNIVHAFMIGWFVVGTYFVFRIWRPNYDAASGPHCARTLYEFAFALLALVYAALVLLVTATVMIVTLTVCTLLWGDAKADGGGDNRRNRGASMV